MRRKVTSSHKGNIFLKDYDVKKAIKNMEDINVVYEGGVMTLTPKDLVDKLVYTSKEYKSNFEDGKSYHLNAYKWIPNLVEHD